MRLALLLVPLLALAGCAAPPAAEPSAERAPPELAAPEPTLAAPAPEPAAPAAKVTHSKPFGFAGTTEAEACPAVGDREQCVFLAPSENAAWDFPDARVLRAEGEVRWVAASPAHEQMYVVLYRANGTAWESLGGEGYTALGTSPLAFGWDLAAFPRDARFRLGVFQATEVNRYPIAVVSVGTPQDFELEGKLWVVS